MEDADDAEGADDAEDGGWDIERSQSDEGDKDDGCVDEVIAIGHKGIEPVRVSVDQQLNGEGARGERVESREGLADRVDGAVGSG